MQTGSYELLRTDEGYAAHIRARGAAVLTTPTVNRGTAFTPDERRALGLTGLLPERVSTIEEQLRRVYAQYLRQGDDLGRWVYLANLRDRNEVLYFRLLAEHIEELLPVVYTPTVGTAIERFSHEFRRPRGVHLCVDRPGEVEEALRNTGLGAGDVDLLVVTDAEGVLGIGDQGAGGIEIAIGKLAVYTAAGGVHPHRVLPVVLDVGTDNPALLDDELYLGARHPRVRGPRYDALLDEFVGAAGALFPQAMLHWEDFGAGNARRILARYADRCASFNDDIQGTAAIVLAAVTAATRATGNRIADQRVVIHGAGTAGLGIADVLRDQMVREGLTRDEATRRFWALDRDGLLTEDRAARLHDFQVPYARAAAEITGQGTGLAEVVARVRPTVLVGTSTQAGAFTEPIVREMAAHTARPVVLPLSNPTARAEAHPDDLLRWAGGRALIATGSPFGPVELNGCTHEVAQANNALVFPGLGLGVTVSRARRVSDGMLAAAADTIAGLADTARPGAPLLPPVRELRAVSAAVAVAVVVAAAEEGLARVPVDDPAGEVRRAMWHPAYPRLEIGAP